MSTATRNGAAPETVALPVNSFREAAAILRRPFTPEAVKWKPQSTTKSGKTLVVAYIDARLVVERLNLVCPHLWHDTYEATAAGLMWCHLTVDGITRSDVGEGKGKALVSDSLKRAAVRFGVGVSLYAVPQQFLDERVEYLKDQHRTLLRNVYARWLNTHGVQAFGEPLDHGDVADHQGDIDEAPPFVNPSTGEITPPPATEPTAKTISVERSTEVGLAVTEALQKGLSADALPSLFAEVGAFPERVNAGAVAALTDKQADRFEHLLVAEIAKLTKAPAGDAA